MATMIELYNALKFITMLFFIQKILRFNLGVAFLKSVSIQILQFLLGMTNIPGSLKSLHFFCMNKHMQGLMQMSRFATKFNGTHHIVFVIEDKDKDLFNVAFLKQTT